MPSRTFRIVQASDIRLEQPPHGLADTADHLTEPLVESTYRAAAAVFDLALAEDVDFVVLAGHLVEPEVAGPRGPTFLAEQFSRLAARGIRVYWATAPNDGRRNWPITLTWPDNVHVFDSLRVERLVHARSGEPLCVLIGRSIDEPADDPVDSAAGGLSTGRLGDLHELGDSLAIDATALAETSTTSSVTSAVPSATTTAATVGAVGTTGYVAPTPLFRIAISPLHHSTVELDAALASISPAAPPCLLAVGGTSPNSTTPSRKPLRMAQSSGSPQGRSIVETGARSALLVEVDPAMAVRAVAKPVDAFRWHDERITLPPGALRAELDHRIHERMQAASSRRHGKMLLVRWTVDGANSLVARARQTGLAGDLLAILRNEYGLPIAGRLEHGRRSRTRGIVAGSLVRTANLVRRISSIRANARINRGERARLAWVCAGATSHGMAGREALACRADPANGCAA